MVVRNERRTATRQLVGHATQCVEIRPGSEHPVSLEHLGRGVAVVVGEAVQGDADPLHWQREIAQDDAIFSTEEDVRRLDPPVGDRARVERGQGTEDLAEDLEDLRGARTCCPIPAASGVSHRRRIAHRVIEAAVGESPNLAGQDQVLMDEMDRSSAEIEELRPKVGLAGELRGAGRGRRLQA